MSTHHRLKIFIVVGMEFGFLCEAYLMIYVPPGRWDKSNDWEVVGGMTRLPVML